MPALLMAIFLVVAGFSAWVISTISGGGGAMLLIPLVGFVVGAEAVAPVVTIATLMGGGGRLLAFRQNVDWGVARWALPGAVLGSAIGAATFSLLPAKLVALVVGVFLLSAPLQYSFGRKERTFKVQKWYFLPAQMLVGTISGLVGAVGPVMNSLYMNAGITKSDMVGTKTVVSLPMHVVKISTYTALGAISGDVLLFGIAAGVGAIAASWIAKRLLDGMKITHFRLIVTIMMALSGAIMIWQSLAP